MASERKIEYKSPPSDVKNDETGEVKNVGDTKEKDDLKNEVEEDSGKEASEDDIEEEEVALLDRPVEVTGCRARKKVERLEVSFSAPKEKQEFPEGKGKKLGECPRIEMQIQKLKVPDLKTLHKILFNRTGSANEIKKNIRRFSGFAFEKDTSEFIRKKASVEKLTALVLKKVCIILDIERGGTKEEIVNRIISFLMNPEDSGKKVPFKSKASKEKKKSAKVKSDLKIKPLIYCSEDEPEESMKEVHEDNSSGGETSVDGNEEELDDDANIDKPKKKSKDLKTSKRISKIGKGNEEKKKQKATKRKQDDSSASSEDEPPIKQSKMPSDEEISKLVKQILDSADLQEITMKKVIKQVSDAYPEFDLSHKKAFIKSTIKTVIS